MTVNIMNPDAAILQQLDGQWQKVCVLLLWKLARDKKITLTHTEIAEFPADRVLFTHGHKDSIDFQIVDQAAAVRLAAHDAATNRGTA